MVYSPPFNISQTGRRFSTTEDYLRHLKIPPSTFLTLKYEDVMAEKYVFVMAASENHFAESKDAIGSVQIYKPMHQIIYYDIGLAEGQVKEVTGSRFKENLTTNRRRSEMLSK